MAEDPFQFTAIRRLWLSSLLFIAMLLTITVPVADAGPPSGSAPMPKSAAEVVKIRILCEAQHIEPGRTFELAVVFDIRDHWHIYWENPGDSGMSTLITLKAPEGYTVGTVRFPRPMSFQDAEGRTMGYEKQTVLFVPITAPKDLDEDEAKFDLDVSYLACRTMCLLGSHTETLMLPTTEIRKRSPLTEADRNLLTRFRKRLPTSITELPGVQINLQGDQLIVDLPTDRAREADLFTLDMPGLMYAQPSITQKRHGLRIEVPVTIRPANAEGKPMAIRGIITLGSNLDSPCYYFNMPLDTDGQLKQPIRVP